MIRRSSRRSQGHLHSATASLIEALESRLCLSTFAVTNLNDSGPGSFRQAALDAGSGADDVITFDAGLTGSINLTSGAIIMAGNLTVTGPGASLLTVQRDAGAAHFGVLDYSGSSLNLSGLTISGGLNDLPGGGLAIHSTPTNVILDHMVFSTNSAASGGAIAFPNVGFLTLRNSTITANTSTSDGGGIVFPAGGSLVVESSTISNNVTNSAGDVGVTKGGGGISFSGPVSFDPPAGYLNAAILIRNSTIDHNRAASSSGGGILFNTNQGNLEIQNTTITANTTAQAGSAIDVPGEHSRLTIRSSTITANVSTNRNAGIYFNSGDPATMVVANSIVSGNSTFDIYTRSISPDFESTAKVNFSAIGSSNSLALAPGSGNNLPYGTDLLLGALADNGGPTQTMLPQPASPLINAGSNALIPDGITTDQRGGDFVRIFNGTVDIGAAEYQPKLTATPSASNVTTGGANSYSFTVTYADNSDIDVSSIIGNNSALRISDGGSFDVPATFVSIDDSSNGKVRNATYSFIPPGGSWDQNDDRNYFLNMQPNQVRDVDGNFSPDGRIGSFAVAIHMLVTNTNDSGPGSLRQAVIEANADPNANFIDFDTAGVFATAQTISLLSALPALSATAGGFTLNGPGASLLTLIPAPPGGGSFRFFNSAAPTLDISGITLTGGGAFNGAGGGAIFVAAGTHATLDGVVITNSKAFNYMGGAIYVDNGGFLTLRNSTLSGNSAVYQSGANSYSGGAIYAVFGTILIESSTISGNSAAFDGGAIFLNGADSSFLTIRNSTISGNTASDSGGAICFAFGGTFLIENSTISGNSTTGAITGGGGGISFTGTVPANPPAPFTPGRLTIRNSTINNNSTPGSGGGIRAGSLLLQNNTIAGNSARFGGGIFGSSLLIQDSTISANTASGGTGGGIFGGSLTITNSVVSGNVNASAADINGTGQSDVDTINFSAIGVLRNATFSASSGNNILPGNLLLGPLADNGGPTKTMLPQSGSPLIDAGSNALIPSGMTTDQRGSGFRRSSGISVDIGAVEIPRPPAATAVAANITSAGATSYSFTVSYFADAGINTTTVIGNNSAMRVTGPKGFDTLANFVSINDSTNGSPRTVSYSFTPPGGSWDGPDSGTYTISTEPNQVTDINGLAVASGALKTFTVSLPQTFIVTNSNDAGPGSLRQAVLDANAVSTFDTIRFDPAVTGAINLTGGTIASTGPLNIVGPGAAVLTLQRDPGAPKGPIFNASSIFNVSDLTITGGQNDSDGGAIFINGVLSLTGVVLTGNSSGNNGGAIYLGSAGSLTLHNTTIAGNTAVAGGAIYSIGGGTIIIDTSTISNNSSSAIVISNAGAVTISNSTITNNTSSGVGGGVYIVNAVVNSFTPNIQNSTITANTAATSGGGIFVGAGGLTVRNSTITANTANGSASGAGGGGIYLNAANALLILGNSIVSGNSNANYPDIRNAGQNNINYSAIGSANGFTLSAPSANNLPFGANLLLGPLADNGGPTQTMMPDSDSPLINAGSSRENGGGLYDQRRVGYLRTNGPSVDIGAVEVDAVLPAVKSSQFNYLSSGPQSLTFKFTEQVDLAKSALELHNVSTNQIIPLDNIALSYDPSTSIATFTFPGYANGVLPDGDYRAFLLKDGVQDPSHNHPAIDQMTIFAFLLGDLNGDRRVSVADFLTLASNSGKSSARYSDGDLNYDGVVSISDFADLASRFNMSLPPPPPATPQAAAAELLDVGTNTTAIHPTRHRKLRHHHARPQLRFRFELR